MFVGVRVPLSVQVEIGSIGFWTAGKENILDKSVFLSNRPPGGLSNSFPRVLVKQFPQRPCQTVAGPCQTVFWFRGALQDYVLRRGFGGQTKKSGGASPFCLRIACLRADTLKFMRPFFVKQSPLAWARRRAEGHKWLDDFRPRTPEG